MLARREEKLRELQAELQDRSPGILTHAIAFDVTDPGLAAKLGEVTGERLDVLINNAGLALGREKAQSARFEDWEQMIGTNITANFRVVHTVLPWMLRGGRGDILNLCSIAGHYTYAGGTVYCATKHAVKAFTRALREETCGKNIRVMQISPGMVNTEFSTVRFGGDAAAADAVYAGMTPLLAEDIARMITFMLEQPRHVVIDEIITMPLDQGSPTTVTRSHR